MVQMVKNLPAIWVSPGLDRWVGKIPWRRAWQLTPVFLPEESHGQRSLGATVTKSRTQLKRLSVHRCTCEKTVQRMDQKDSEIHCRRRRKGRPP